MAFKTTVPDVLRDLVLRWFDGDRSMPHRLSQDRAVEIHLGNNHSLKIKGAGFRGGPIAFDVHRNTGPRAPMFDFDGRFIHDVATSHDTAPTGGMSFQQAATEWSAARWISNLNLLPVVPCHGWGSLRCQRGASWFSLHDWPDDYVRMRDMPGLTMDQAGEFEAEVGRAILALMLHGICGQMANAYKGSEAIYFDLHPFRSCDSLAMSGLSFVMHLLYNLHVRGLTLLLDLSRTLPGSAENASTRPFRCLLPDVTSSDYSRFRQVIVAKYCVARPRDFRTQRLLRDLKSTRISAAAMEIVPPGYAWP